MGDGIEQGSPLRIHKGLGGQAGAVEGAVGVEDILAEGLNQFSKCRLAGFDDIAGYLIRVDDEESFR